MPSLGGSRGKSAEASRRSARAPTENGAAEPGAQV
jgi:hypothetical protein